MPRRTGPSAPRRMPCRVPPSLAVVGPGAVRELRPPRRRSPGRPGHRRAAIGIDLKHASWDDLVAMMRTAPDAHDGPVERNEAILSADTLPASRERWTRNGGS